MYTQAGTNASRQSHTHTLSLTHTHSVISVADRIYALERPRADHSCSRWVHDTRVLAGPGFFSSTSTVTNVPSHQPGVGSSTFEWACEPTDREGRTNTTGFSWLPHSSQTISTSGRLSVCLLRGEKKRENNGNQLIKMGVKRDVPYRNIYPQMKLSAGLFYKFFYLGLWILQK